MSENEVVRELLGRAVDTVPVPVSPGSEAVFARASRVRRRRRAAATGMVAAAVAAGVVVGSGVLPGGQGENVAASPTAGELGGGAAGFAKLLPGDVGKVREVRLGPLLKGVSIGKFGKKPKPVGSYDGEYTVARDGGVGIITVHAAEHATPDPAPCDMPHETPLKLNCTTEQVDGGVLHLWQWNWDEDSATRWGSELDAQLVLKDGTMLDIHDSTGFLGQGSQGPLLKSFPLSRSQLRELALRPELRP
ncbi:hypothetical protein [Streptomyces brasiliensis]|uniref:Uncharacterized protein n=1 Tax=Streptomyces brasiliensis TaxID=1954 RepID=A0A917KF92_9ACTN|nr:hypothetical protein [Streptomyces brasiliensis]GGJ11287.1 hypothetical protein GCM10010121_022070 [Streptomyces brasiliensis]